VSSKSITTFGRELNVKAWTSASSARKPSRPSTPTQDVEGDRISDLEQRVVMMLPHQTETFLNALQYHWHNYKTNESGAPLSYFESELGLLAKIESDKNGVWAEVYELNSFKNEVALL
jgi:hypothetical protein